MGHLWILEENFRFWVKNPICIFRASYNRMIVFDSHLKHGRNIFENFGTGNLSRLIQVTFLRKK